MQNGGQRSTGDRGGDPWVQFEAFLQTDPRDVGCDATMEMLDVYAELLAGGSVASERFPGLHAHLLTCGPCAEDLAGLLAAISAETGSGSEPR